MERHLLGLGDGRGFRRLMVGGPIGSFLNSTLLVAERTEVGDRTYSILLSFPSNVISYSTLRRTSDINR